MCFGSFGFPEGAILPMPFHLGFVMPHVHPKLEFIPQRFNPLVLQFARSLLPILLSVRLRPWLPSGISDIEVVNGKTLVELFHQFQLGKIRLLIAFRHPHVDDPLCMFHLLSKALSPIARQHQIPLRHPIHSHFLYDRGMTIWAGKWLGWFFSRMGGIPIHRGKRLDRTGMKAAREILLNGKFPLAIAPEGATNGLSNKVSPLEPGMAQLGVWCLEDLAKANRFEDVIIVPIGIQYFYPEQNWAKIDHLLTQLETEIGLAPLRSIEQEVEQRSLHHERLLRLVEQVFTEMEQFYQRIYHQEFPTIADDPKNRTELISLRLQSLLDVALRVSEQYFGLQPNGTVIDRCRRLEEASWSLIYPEEITDLHQLALVKQGLADWAAEEAELRIRHMRLVESFVGVTEKQAWENLTLEQFSETLLIVFDVIARMGGKKVPRRPRLGWRQARLSIAEPISVRDRWNDNSGDHKASRRAVLQLTQDLQTALENLITHS